MEKEKTIVIDFKMKKKLLKFGSYPTIRKALSGDANTPQKIEIRAEALKLGGKIKETETESQTEISSASSDCTPFI
jgi:hypothetical protein